MTRPDASPNALFPVHHNTRGFFTYEGRNYCALIDERTGSAVIREFDESDNAWLILGHAKIALRGEQRYVRVRKLFDAIDRIRLAEAA